MTTFNIGDKVIIKHAEELNDCPYVSARMVEHAGQTVTIIDTHGGDYIIAEDEGEISSQGGHFYWHPKCFVGLAPKEDYSGEWFWYEEARCPVWAFAENEKHDENHGYCCILPEANYHNAQFGLESYNRKTPNYFIPEFQAYFINGRQLKPITWRVVDRKPRVGDYIRLKHDCYTFDKKDQILIVSEVENQLVKVQTKDYYTTKAFKESGHDSDYLWCYNKDAYEVVEPYTGREGLIKPELWLNCIDITDGEIRQVTLKYYEAHKSILRPLIRLEE